MSEAAAVVQELQWGFQKREGQMPLQLLMVLLLPLLPQVSAAAQCLPAAALPLLPHTAAGPRHCTHNLPHSSLERCWQLGNRNLQQYQEQQGLQPQQQQCQWQLPAAAVTAAVCQKQVQQKLQVRGKGLLAGGVP
jgi:hypothetical protein